MTATDITAQPVREAQPARFLNTVRGKALAGTANTAEILAVFGHIDALEDLLDEGDEDAVFGMAGWRCRLGIDD